MECCGEVLVGTTTDCAAFFPKETLPSGPCESSLIQVQAGGRAPLSSLEINVPGLLFFLAYHRRSNRVDDLIGMVYSSLPSIRK